MDGSVVAFYSGLFVCLFWSSKALMVWVGGIWSFGTVFLFFMIILYVQSCVQLRGG